MRVRSAARYAALATTTCLLVILGPPLGFANRRLAVGAQVAAAQGASRIASPVLLKRLAEVVDGDRTGATLWIVANYDFPHRVGGTYRRQADALRVARDSGSRWDAFGPYQSLPDAGRVMNTLMRCKHDQLTSYMEPAICPPQRTGGRALSLADVDSMTLTFQLSNGSSQSYGFSGTTDAIFLTLSAVDKFAMPYYARILGVESAAAMRRDIVQRVGAP